MFLSQLYIRVFWRVSTDYKLCVLKLSKKIEKKFNWTMACHTYYGRKDGLGRLLRAFEQNPFSCSVFLKRNNSGSSGIKLLLGLSKFFLGTNKFLMNLSHLLRGRP